MFQTLLAFHNAIRSLGSTATLVKTADILRSDLLMVLDLFYTNATQSFKGLPHSSSRLPNIRLALAKRQRWEDRLADEPYNPPPVMNIPDALNRLASIMGKFLKVVIFELYLDCALDCSMN